MNETLLIRLASHAQQTIYWWLFTADDQLLFSGELADAASLANLQSYAASRQVIALVPACDVVLKSVSLPGKLTRKTQNALPFLLEDEVVEDPIKLHVAVLAHEPPLVHLSAIEHSVMQQWLKWLEDAGLTVNRMLPDVFALPDYDTGCRGCLGEQYLIRESRWRGMVLEQELMACLPEDNIARWQSAPQTLPLRVSHLPAGTLLQGAYQPRKYQNGQLAIWRMPAWLLAASLVITLASTALENFTDSREQAQLNQQMVALYRQTFPGNKRVSDPWNEFQKKMEARSSHFLPLVRTLDSVLPSSVQVQSLQFDAPGRELQAQLSGATAIALKAMEQQLPANFSLRVNEKDGATIYLRMQTMRPKVAHSELTHVQQMKQKLARMQILAAQKPLLPAPDADIATLIEQASLKAHLPVSPPAQQGNQFEFRYPGALRFSDFANWLQTLELQYGIVAQQVQLASKGQGTVEVKRLVLSRGSHS